MAIKLLLALLLLAMPWVIHAQDIESPKTDTGKPKFFYVEQMAVAPYDIHKYLRRHIKYPREARKQNIQGRVTIKFCVEEDGSITDCKVLTGIGGGCDEEALRVVSEMPAWLPAKQKGKPIKIWFTLPISFSTR